MDNNMLYRLVKHLDQETRQNLIPNKFKTDNKENTKYFKSKLINKGQGSIFVLKIIEILNSQEMRSLTFHRLQVTLDQKLGNRMPIACLRKRNILKEPLDFKTIHSKLETIFANYRPINIHGEACSTTNRRVFREELFRFKVDPRHFKVAVFLDFEFKRRILEKKIGCLIGMK